MGQQVSIIGLPRNLRMDAWWFSADLDVEFPKPPHKEKTETSGGHVAGGIAAAALVMLADWLFWGENLGLSLAIFAMALAGVAYFVQTRRRTRLDGVKAAGIMLLVVLPIIEKVQFLSVMSLLLGLIGFAVWLASDRLLGWLQNAVAMGRFTFLGPLFFLRDAWIGYDGVTITNETKRTVLTTAYSWVLPVSIGSIFLMLLMSANPFLDDWVSDFFSLDKFGLVLFKRVLFWTGMLSVIWPFLHLAPFAVKAISHKPISIRTLQDTSIFNAASVRNSLLLFNAMFAIQILTDGLFLWGGTALPDGMSYASYAHRGAYPLIVTALLAGVFAVITQKYTSDRLIRWMMFLWIGQNLMLVFAAMFRLKIYIDAYALTYMRVAAFIWMGLVFVGLALIITQIARKYSVGWLMKTNFEVFACVLYACCFINFAGSIATYNILHLKDNSDRYYVCSLGPQALPAIAKYNLSSDEPFPCGRSTSRMRIYEGWKDWGFRDWRLTRYLDEIDLAGDPDGADYINR